MKTMFQRISFFSLFLLCFGYLHGQQDPLNNFYMLNQLAINPAYAGSLDHYQATGLFRRQWFNIPGSPSTSIFSLQGNVEDKNMGYGLVLQNDQLGVMSNTGATFIYAYNIQFEKSKLSAGIQTGIYNYRANLTESSLSLTPEFDAAFANNISSWNLNFGAGLFYSGANWFASFSVPHLRTHDFNDDALTGDLKARLVNHYFLSGAYVFNLSDEFSLKPGSLIKIAGGTPLQFDFSTTAYYLNNYGFGLSFRTGGAFVTMAEIRINKKFFTGISYDFAVGSNQRQLGGAFEILLKYDFKKSSESPDFENRLF